MDFNGNFCVVGGISSSFSNLGTAWCYQPAINQWYQLPNMTTPRGSLTATFYRGIYAIGGIANFATLDAATCNASGAALVCGTVERYGIAPARFATSTKSVTPQTVPSGGLITYTLMIANSGQVAGTAALTDTLPSNTTLNSKSPSLGFNGVSLTASPVLQPGASATYTFTVQVSPQFVGTISNSYQLSGDGSLRTISGPNVTVTAPAATATPTTAPSATSTATTAPSATSTATTVPSVTSTSTVVPSPTSTVVPSATSTATTAPSATSTATSVPSPTSTAMPSATSTATTAPSATSTATVTTPTTDVIIQNFAFVPQHITITVNTAVRWTNLDGAPHTSTSTTGVWDSGTLTTGQSFSFTFSTVGLYPYICAIHQGMTGTVAVIDPNATATPTLAPSTTATAQPTATGTVVPSTTATTQPTTTATVVPSTTATAQPTTTATVVPSTTATTQPTTTATVGPSSTATTQPTMTGTVVPSSTATTQPSATTQPTITTAPSTTATAQPSASSTATAQPSATTAPSSTATAQPSATTAPSSTATAQPSATTAPSSTATAQPTVTRTATTQPTATRTATATATQRLVYLPLVLR